MTSSLFGYKKAIIWDWNGTLLNDIAICIHCMNMLLRDRQLPLLDREKYREIFTFPVKDYYRKAGIDFHKEDFEKPAMEFIKLYYTQLTHADLFPDTIYTLKELANRGYYQTILSAMEHESLVESLHEKGVYNFFDLVNGIGDHYAHSKLEVGVELLKKMNFSKKEIILVGDSLHDLEVANSLELDYVLIANGHQSKQRLQNRTSQVIDELSDILKLLN
jgi:phosphoglycolate phosphatase